MHNKVPAKKTDPGSFTIECFIGHNYPTKALCDPGAKGKIEDILVKVDKFIFPADFLILDCEANEYDPIILGRPFLSTSRAVLDFDKDEIIFKVENDSVKMKSLTEKLNEEKDTAEPPAKDTPRTKLYMGAHVERDKAAMTQNKWKKPTREKETKPKAPAQKAQHGSNSNRQKITAVMHYNKTRQIFPPDNSWQSNPRPKRKMANISSSARYTMVAAKNKWEEQGFHFDDGLPNYGLEQFVYNRLNELGWFRLAQQPARANYNWVLEFYTSNSAGEDNALVHGK
ncbi:hypothetical protein V6N13_098561 [Hibiscus sabdariffa]